MIIFNAKAQRRKDTENEKGEIQFPLRLRVFAPLR
jgi:hypothetical protein